MKKTDLSRFVGKDAVYVDDGVICLVKVVSTQSDDRLMLATVESAADLLFRIRTSEFSRAPSPFGDCWDIGQEGEFFYLDDDYWDGSLRSGFRLIFSADVVAQFLSENVSWIDNYF